MSQKLLRHKPTGDLYIWQEAFAFRPDFEEVVDVTPEETKAPETIAPAKVRKTRKPEPAPVDEAAIQADASRDLP